MYTIAVPLDGSSLAETALPHAVALATRCDTTLILVMTAGRDTEPEAPDTFTGQVEPLAYIHHVRQAVSQVLASFQFTPNRIQAIVVDTVEGDAIEDSIPLTDADLVVVATHGYTGFRRAMEGSLTARILARRLRPTLVVSPQSEFRPQALPYILQHTSPLATPDSPILLPLDGTRDAESILQCTLTLAQKLTNPVYLLSVVPPMSHSMPDPPAGKAAVSRSEVELQHHYHRAEQYMQQLQQYIEGHGVVCEWRVLIGDPLEQITQSALRLNAGMIAMATHAHGQMAEYLAGSLTHTVLLQSHKPVLMLRCPEHPDAVALPSRNTTQKAMA